MTNENIEWAIRVGDLNVIKSKISEKPDIVNLLGPTGRTLLCIAADYGQHEIIKCLIENGADVNLADTHGITPLLSAIYENHKECVKLLLLKNADKNKKAPDGKSYVDCAEDSDIRSLLVN